MGETNKQLATKYRRTFKGRLHRMYSSQRANAKRRNHHLPTYTKQEFFYWAICNDYYDLYNSWKKQDFLKKATPSADRLDNTKSYTLSNLRLTTWEINDAAAHLDFKSGKLFNKQTKVNQFTKTGIFIATHVSQSAAARAVNTSQGNIGRVCRGGRKSVKGFLWEFTNE